MACVDCDTDNPACVADRASSKQDVLATKSHVHVIGLIGTLKAIDLIVGFFACDHSSEHIFHFLQVVQSIVYTLDRELVLQVCLSV